MTDRESPTTCHEHHERSDPVEAGSPPGADPAGRTITLRAFTAADLQQLADEHQVLPETVLRAACGLPVKGRAGDRARAAAAALRGAA